jgi:hypothetical protein
MLIDALQRQFLLQQKIHMNSIRNFDNLCQQLRGTTSILENPPRTLASGNNSSTLAWVLRLDPLTPIPMDSNSGNISLALIPTPILQACVATLLFELGE